MQNNAPRTQAETALALKIRRIHGYFHVALMGAGFGASVGAIWPGEYADIVAARFMGDSLLRAIGFLNPSGGGPGMSLAGVIERWKAAQRVWLDAWPPHPWTIVWDHVGVYVACGAILGVGIATAIRVWTINHFERKTATPAGAGNETILRGAARDDIQARLDALDEGR